MNPYSLMVEARVAGNRFGLKLALLTWAAHNDLENMVAGASCWLPDQVEGLTKELQNLASIEFYQAARKALGWDA